MPPYENWPPYGNQLSPDKRTDLHDASTSMFLPVPAKPLSLQVVAPVEKPAIVPLDRRESEPVRWSLGCSILLIIFILSLSFLVIPGIKKHNLTMIPTPPAIPRVTATPTMPAIPIQQLPIPTPTATPAANPVTQPITSQPTESAAPPTLPPPTPTSVDVPTPTPTSAPTQPCSVSYTVRTQWPGGFTVDMVITNTSDRPLNGWFLQFTFTAGQRVTQVWNGSVWQRGGNVAIYNANYNTAIEPGGSVNPGFNGSWNESNPAPTAFTLNGMTCSVA